ncbi:SAF domain-containing protein [Corynebacterium vitaeruminis]|uniref:SAF domain-containing protein n=1 Tax=Corynebacterium vitaeruminis DSM 20294 TaxID=1224164 RepID=W5XZ70_9CORY|nr:SAF domain-containing protein [Corynebacterium vitaeruminis]AHI22306.1 hypothetical protein B843_04585 [Corynebacterium vitaeruminis DSM 20294]
MSENKRWEALARPGYRRSQFIRRSVAVALVLAALLFTAWESRGSTAPVVVASRDVSAGSLVAETDLKVARFPANLVPEGALTDPGEASGRVAASAMSTGMPVLASSVVSLELSHSVVSKSTGDEVREPYNMVPIRLADPALAPLLVHGDTVTVVAGDGAGDHGEVIATGGTVIFTSVDDSQKTGVPAGTVMIALPESQAQNVATASLSRGLAVVLSGTRANLT